MITKVCETRSIQIEVPVKPVCPNDPSGNSSPRFDENEVFISHPKVRVSPDSETTTGAVIRATVSAEIMRTEEAEIRPVGSVFFLDAAPETPSLPLGFLLVIAGTTPPFKSIWQNRARSSAVEKSPAWPATPLIRNAVG